MSEFSFPRSARRIGGLTALAAATLGVGAAPALADSASGSVSSFSVTPASQTAGASADVATDIEFGTPTSVSSLVAALPPGLWAALPAAPNGTTIGTGTVSVSGIGNATATITSEAIPSGAAAQAPSGTMPVLGLHLDLSLAGQSVDSDGFAALDPKGPNLVIDFPSLQTTVGPLTLAESSIKLKLLGTVTPAGSSSTASFIRLPSYQGAATTSLSVNSGATGSGTATGSFTMTGAPAYTPSVASVNAKVVDANKDAQVTVDIQQPAGQGGSAGNSLQIPTSVLATNPGVAADFTGSPVQVGTAQLSTPLWPTPVAGTFDISGSLLAPVATVSFPTFGISFSGSITNPLSNPTVAFKGIPDIPFTDLSITMTGASNGLFQAACNGQSGSATSSFTSQWGTTTPAASTPVNVTGCPSGGTTTTTTPTTTVGKPTVSGLSLSGLAKGKAKLVFTAAQGKNASKLNSLTITVPKGLSLVKKGLKKGVAVSGAKVAKESISHGKLVITFKSAAAKAKVTISSKALAVSKSLRTSVKKKKTKSLSGSVVVKAGKVSTTLKLTFKKLS